MIFIYHTKKTLIALVVYEKLNFDEENLSVPERTVKINWQELGS